MFKMSAFSFDACHVSFAKFQNRPADCFIMNIVRESPHIRFRIHYIPFLSA